MKKLLLLVMSLIMLFGASVSAESNDTSWLANAKTYEGEALLPLIDENSVIPFYYLKDDGYENLFKTYQKGNFISQFNNGLIEFVIKANEGKQIYCVSEDISQDGEYVAEKDNTYELFKSFYDGSVKLPENAEDVRISWVESIRTPMFLYYRTDKGEFIVLNKTYTSKYAPDKTFEGGKAYSPEEFVEYCVRVKDARVAEAKENNRDGEVITTDENGDVVTITPKPEKTDKPETTPSPKPTATAEPAIEPTVTPTPTATPHKLEVKGGGEIEISVDGKAVEFDAKPFIDGNNRTLVPVRAVSEMLDCNVDWSQEMQTVTIIRGEKVITIVIGEDLLMMNNEKIQMDTKAIIKDERTFIPVRFAAEALGLTVNWVE